MSVKTYELPGGVKKLIDRQIIADTGNTPRVRLMKDVGFQPSDKDCDLYQCDEGFAIIVNRNNFNVGDFTGGEIIITRKH